MNTRIMTAVLVALTMIVMAMTPLINEAENLEEISTVGYDHGGGVPNGTAMFEGILTWQDDAWNSTWNCTGGLALVTPYDWSNFLASGDNDPHDFSSWGIELTGAGSYFTELAPEGEWVVTAGLGCTDDDGEPRAAGGQFGDVHENPPTVNLTNDTMVGDVSFTLIEHGEGLPSPQEFMDMFDADGSGNLSLEEIIDGFNSHNNESGEPPLSEEDEGHVEDAFNNADYDGNGALDLDELEYFIDMMEDDDGGEGRTFICGNGDEIPFEWVNDGDQDCPDGADEQQYNATDGSRINWYDCEDGTTEVWIEQVNDGTEDCPDGDDEYDGDDGWDFEDGYAIMNVSLNPVSPYDETTWECDDGGIALLNQSGIDAWNWSNIDDDQELLMSWGTDVYSAGEHYVDYAISGDWYVIAGLECWESGSDNYTFFGGTYLDATGSPIQITLEDNVTYAELVSITLQALETSDFDDDDGAPSAEELMFMWDADGDGNLSLVEFIDGINGMNSDAGEPPLSDEEEAMFSYMFNESDYNGDGLLDYDELGYFIDLMDSEDDGPTFVCGNGEEIPFDWVNDGYEDCSDGSDEPQDFDGDGVIDNWFDCHDGSNITMDLVNDGTEDCPDGEDEGNYYDDGPPSPEELLYMFDADGDGNLSLDELVNGINAKNNESGEPPMSEEEEDYLENGFNMADADGNGLLDIYELEDLIDMWEDEGGDPDFTYGDATLDATTYVMSPDYDPTMMNCEGGVALMTAEDFGVWAVLEDDPNDYLTWGTDHHTAGNVVDDTAPEGEYVVLAVLECMDLSGVHWIFGGYDMSADGTPTMHTFTNGSTTTVEINLFNMDDIGGGEGGDEDYFDCGSDDSISIFFEEVTDVTGILTFTAVCALSAENSQYVRGMIDAAGDNDGNVSTTELAAFMAMMLDSEDDDCYDENGTAIPCGGDDGVFEFDGVEIDAMNDAPTETISGVLEGGVITMTSTDVITLVLDPAVDTHTLTYESTDADGGDEECSVSLSIDSASPWSTTSVTFNPSDDWDVEPQDFDADGVIDNWLVSNIDSDGDGECNSEPTSVEIVWTRPTSEPEPVIDTTPVCDIYYHVGGAVLTAGSSWSVQLQGAVSFEVPSNGEYSLALPVGSYSVVLACNDAESDAIVVSVTDGTDTWGGTAQDGVIYAEGMFEITEENVNSAVDINLTWSSTDFGGTFNVHFTAVESIADAIEDSDIGGLPGFTSVVTITAMLGAAMILARRKD